MHRQAEEEGALCWASTDDNAARRRPVVASRTACGCASAANSPRGTTPTSAASCGRAIVVRGTPSALLRYSFGYPACPDLGDRVKLVALLRPERIGVVLSEELQLHPEQSTDALIVHHPEAKYFNVT
jgi:Vitamin B12 dependent methionine synthase, activation domain